MMMFSCVQVEEFSNRVAHYFKSVGLNHGDTVALFMESKPEYVCIWLGLSKIGVVTALINSNLRQLPLIHTIKIASSRAVIFGSELASGECSAVCYLYIFVVQY
jgi:solute carrier family 27 fatty acid transporter 1/4